MAEFSLHLLGGFAVHRGEQSVDLPPACQRLVALIALKRKPVHRLWVCAILWPHAPTRRAVASLRSAMWRLRPAGADPLLIADPQHIQLAPEVSVDWHDSVDLIEQLLGGEIDPQLVADLLPLLRAGELLDTWAEPWVAHERNRYHGMRTSALETLGHGTDKVPPHHKCGSIRSVHVHRSIVTATSDITEADGP
jgi:DNA-binding SARP family transcriptional activator